MIPILLSSLSDIYTWCWNDDCPTATAERKVAVPSNQQSFQCSDPSLPHRLFQLHHFPQGGVRIKPLYSCHHHWTTITSGWSPELSKMDALYVVNMPKLFRVLSTLRLPHFATVRQILRSCQQHWFQEKDANILVEKTGTGLSFSFLFFNSAPEVFIILVSICWPIGTEANLTVQPI